MRQLDLFSWGQPTKRFRATGFIRLEPCACGRTHSLVWLDHPYNGMIDLHSHRISEPSQYVVDLMAERYEQINQPPPRLG